MIRSAPSSSGRSDAPLVNNPADSDPSAGTVPTAWYVVKTGAPNAVSALRISAAAGMTPTPAMTTGRSAAAISRWASAAAGTAPGVGLPAGATTVPPTEVS